MNCLDDFYFKFLKIVKSHEVAPILKLLVTLIYDQSWIERGICGQTYNVEKRVETAPENVKLVILELQIPQSSTEVKKFFSGRFLIFYKKPKYHI